MKTQIQRLELSSVSPATVSPATVSPAAASRVRARLWLGFGCFTLACASEGVDLGDGTVVQNLERGSRCKESTRIEQSVVVSNQEELASLAGCEEIRGNLIVRIFAGADLTPLHALRVVEGQFALGIRPDWDEILGFLVSDRLDPEVALVQAGWLSSLSGVAALERVGALYLRGVPDADLTAFESLQSVGGSLGGVFGGQVILQQNLQLHDLTGLEKLVGVRGLTVSLSPLLSSLNGLHPDQQLQSVALYNSSALADLGVLAPVTSLQDLILYGIGVTNAEAFSALQSVRGSLSLNGNPELVDASGLGALQTVDQLAFSNNAQLKTLPAFGEFTTQPGTIVVRDNPELEALVLDFPKALTRTYYLEDFPSQPSGDRLGVELGIDVIDVRNNARLQSISVPSGLTKAHLVLLDDNPALTAIDFGSLRELGQLSIDNNPNLSQVVLGELTAVSSLQVTGNPRLSGAVFEGLPTLARDISGGAP